LAELRQAIRFCTSRDGTRIAYAVMGKVYFRALRSSGLPMRVLLQGPRLVVVSRE